MKFGTLQGVLDEPLPQAFTVARELGFDGVELDWHDLAEAQPGGPLGPEHRAELRQAAAAAGVEIPSVAAHFLNRIGLAGPDQAQQQLGLESVRAGIELCQDLGASVLLVPFFGPAILDGPDKIQRLTETLQQLAPTAESAQITLAIEHTLSGDQAASLLDAVGSPYVHEYWDMGNCMGFGYDPLQDIERLSSHLAQVHAKEYDQAGGSNAKPLGQGQVPVREILAALSRLGYDGYIVLETGKFNDPKGSAQAALKVLQASS